VTTRPSSIPESGLQFAVQQDTWYEGSSGGSPPFFIRVRRRLTKDYPGLEVEVAWRAHDYPSRLSAMKSSVEAFRVQLEQWWKQYKNEHPQLQE
jgi:hypothetical protein